MNNSRIVKVRPQKPKDIRKEIYNRSLYLYYAFLIVATIIVIRIITIQYGPEGSELRAEAKGQKSFGTKTTEAKRGNILSSDNRLLATTIPLFDIHMDFKAEGLTDKVFEAEVGSLSIKMAEFFKDKPATAYRDSLSRWHAQRLRYKKVTPRRVNYIELKEILAFPIFNRGRNKGGVLIDTMQKRVFPHGDLARRTIGRSNNTGSKFGIEGYFDKQLAGTNGVTAVQKISGNFWMPIQSESNINPIDGYDIATTINIEVQETAEATLRDQLIKHEAIWGTAILMEVETGEIRAIANLARKEIDGKMEVVEDYNYGIGMNMEPGSTFKLVSLMALLDDAKASINESFDTESGLAYIGQYRTRVADSHSGGFGVLSLKRIFEVSSNIGFAKAINKYYGRNPAQFIEYIYKLGLNEKFDMQIAGESAPIIRHPKDKLWNGSTLTMMSFGYAMLMTPIHTLSIYNAIANNGRLMKPLLVTEVKNRGAVIEQFEPQVITEKICSPTTLNFLKQSLEGVVNDGTAAVLRNKNYSVAGKTGTAQVAKGKYGYMVNGGRYYLASIVGYFPADKPKYSCIVAIETYHGPGSKYTYYGGSLSGPVFRAIADKIYSQSTNWYGSTPVNRASQAAEEAPSSAEINSRQRATSPPQIKGGEAKRTADILKSLSIQKQFSSVEGFVRPDSSSTRLTTIPLNEAVIPDTRGMALRDAILLLESRGLRIISRGRGAIAEQTPINQPYQHGDTVQLVLR